MGTDIYILVQVLDWTDGNYRFVYKRGDSIYLTDKCPLELVNGDESDDEQPAYSSAYNVHIPRDYVLFAKIANIRNEYGLVDVLEPRGLPVDLKDLDLRKVLESGTHYPVTHLYPTDIERLNLDECPIFKTLTIVHWREHEEFMQSKDRKVSEKDYLRLFSYAGLESIPGACGMFYTFMEWEAFSKEKRDQLVVQHKGSCYIEINASSKRHSGGVEALKKLGEEIQRTWEYRLIVFFDSA